MAEVKCSSVCSKIILLVVFAFLWLASGALIFVGAYTFHIGGNIESVARSTNIFVPAMVIIAAGIFLFVVGLIGCFACTLESKCLLTTFFSLLLVVFVSQIVAAVLAFVFSDKIENTLKSKLFEELQNYGSSEAITAEIDFIQSSYECCGVRNASDWTDTAYYKKHNNTLPDSCCTGDVCYSDFYSPEKASGAATTSPALATTAEPKGLVYPDACLHKLNRQLKSNLAYIMAFGGVLSLFQFFGLIATIIILCRSGEPRYEQFSSVNEDLRI